MISGEIGFIYEDTRGEPPFCYDPEPPPGPNIGAIVGGVVAGIVVLCGCLGAGFYIILRANQKNQNNPSWGVGQSQEKVTGWPTN